MSNCQSCGKPACNCTVSPSDVLFPSDVNGLCVEVNAGDSILTILNRLCQKINTGTTPQVQADWLTVNPGHPSYIKNKPHIMTPQEVASLVNQILSNAVIDWSQLINVPNFLTESDFLSLLQNYLQTHGYLTQGDLLTYLTTHGYITNQDFLDLLQDYLNSQDFFNLLNSLLNSYFSNYALVETDPTVPFFVKNIIAGTSNTQVAKWTGSTYGPHTLTFSDITGTINSNQYNQNDIFDIIGNYFTTIGTANVPITTTHSLGIMQVGPGLEVTTGGIVSVIGSTTPTTSPCGTPIAYKGGASWPTSIEIDLGSGTGLVTLSYQAYSVPDKFILMYDGVEVINTGYVGDKWRQTGLNNALIAKGVATETITGPGKGTISFTKTTATTTATLIVWAPVASTGWQAFVSCPGSPVPDTSDVSIYSVDGYLEQNRIVSFNNNSLTFENAGSALDLYIKDLPTTTPNAGGADLALHIDSQGKVYPKAGASGGGSQIEVVANIAAVTSSITADNTSKRFFYVLSDSTNNNDISLYIYTGTTLKFLQTVA